MESSSTNIVAAAAAVSADAMGGKGSVIGVYASFFSVLPELDALRSVGKSESVGTTSIVGVYIRFRISCA